MGTRLEKPKNEKASYGKDGPFRLTPTAQYFRRLDRAQRATAAGVGAEPGPIKLPPYMVEVLLY